MGAWVSSSTSISLFHRTLFLGIRVHLKKNTHCYLKQVTLVLNHQYLVVTTVQWVERHKQLNELR
jgi:hypothetical protein